MKAQRLQHFEVFFPAVFLAALQQQWPTVRAVFLQDLDSPVIALAPRWLLEAQDGQYWLALAATDLLHSSRQTVADPLQTLLALWQPRGHASPVAPAGFQGGLAGFLGHELMAAHTLGLPCPQPDSALGGLWVGEFAVFLRADPGGGWTLYGPDQPELQTLYQAIAHCATVTAQAEPLQLQGPFTPRWSPAQYQAAFTQVQAYLQAGDCYQVNLTQPFEADVTGSLLSVAASLWQYSRAPFAGWLQMGGGEELLSCSPELFLALDAQQQVRTRPIKGTRPRHADPVQDAALADELRHSLKDRAENLMIVDLLRNDLGQLAVNGSVTVPALFELESFAQVHHLVSEVQARLSGPAAALPLLLAALPGGSITGAPKIRALQIIAELEAGPRGAYCGSLGYLNHDGSGRWNILIRTLQREGNQLRLWAGGGITVASDWQAEYQECLDKVGGLMAQVERLTCP